MSETILVIAAHPDDEVLGCGGTLARHVDCGDTVHILLLGDGVGSRGDLSGIEARNLAAMKAAKALGVKPPRLFNFPDNSFDSLSMLEIVKIIEGQVEKVRPSVVYTHHGGDLNIDHVRTHQAVLTACRPLPGVSIRAVYGFEVLSSTEWGSLDQGLPFRPTYAVDVTTTWERKIAALQCYSAEMRDFPHARSFEAVEALARLRGAENGCTAAEGFTVLRQIWRLH